MNNGTTYKFIAALVHMSQSHPRALPRSEEPTADKSSARCGVRLQVAPAALRPPGDDGGRGRRHLRPGRGTGCVEP